MTFRSDIALDTGGAVTGGARARGAGGGGTPSPATHAAGEKKNQTNQRRRRAPFPRNFHPTQKPNRNFHRDRLVVAKRASDLLFRRFLAMAVSWLSGRRFQHPSAPIGEISV